MAIGARSTSLANLIQGGSRNPLSLISPRGGLQIPGDVFGQQEQNPGSGFVRSKIQGAAIDAFQETDLGKSVSKGVNRLIDSNPVTRNISKGIRKANSLTDEFTNTLIQSNPITRGLSKGIQKLNALPGEAISGAKEALGFGAAAPAAEAEVGAAITGAAASEVVGATAATAGAAEAAAVAGSTAAAGGAAAGGAAAGAAGGSAAAAAVPPIVIAFCMGAAQYYPLGSADWIQTRRWLKDDWKGPIANLFRLWYGPNNLWLGEQIQKRPILKKALRPFFEWARRKGSPSKDLPK